MKRITVVVAGSGGKKEYKDVELMPLSRASDVLNKLGVQDMYLCKPGGGVFAMADEVYPMVEDSTKLLLSPTTVDAGL